MSSKLPLAKKHLGQNFLKNKHILSTIVGGDLIGANVFEIGPGPGDLTEAILAKNPSSLSLIEIDKDMIPLLQERFTERNITLHLQDILKTNILQGNLEPHQGFFVNERQSNIVTEKYILYGNIPYYITSPIIHHFLYDVDFPPEKMIFTMQKEVADRILARDGQHSVLSIACHLVSDIEKVCDIHPGNFIPQPKVWSSCLRFTFKNKDRKKMRKVLQLVQLGFSQKRKKLLSNLSQRYDKNTLESCFIQKKLSLDVRAEQLSIEQWESIAEMFL